MSGQKEFYFTLSISLWPVILYSATMMGMSYRVARWSAIRVLETERRAELEKALVKMGEKKIDSDAATSRSMADAAVELKKIDVEKEAHAARAWDKLSTRAILKKADPGLERYFEKQEEYREAKSDLRAVGDRGGINTLVDCVAMVKLVNGIRLSPFFDTQEERDSLLRMVERVKRQGVGFPCAELDEELKKISSSVITKN